MAIARKYTDEVRSESVRRVLERREAEPESRSILREVASDYGVGVQSLRQWVAKVDDGTYDYDDGPAETQRRLTRRPRAVAERVRELEALVAELREENEVLRRAIAVLARAGSEPAPH